MASTTKGKRSVKSVPFRVSGRTRSELRQPTSLKPSCLISCSQPGPVAGTLAPTGSGRQNKTDWRYRSWRALPRRGGRRRIAPSNRVAVPRHLRSPPSPLTEPLACRRPPADDCLARKGKTVCRLGLESFFLFMADRVTVDMPSSKGILPLLATWPRSGGAHFCRQQVLTDLYR
jgi:hypothetical protein